MLRLLLAALLALGGLPVTDDILARLERLESRAIALDAQQRAMATEMVRRRGPSDAMTDRDIAALLSPRGLTAALGSRSAVDRTPDLATPLMARLRDDASLSAYAAGRTDTFDGYANMLADPTFDTLRAPIALTTSYAAIGEEWEAKYVLNSGTVATTRTMGRAAVRGDTGVSILSSGLGILTLIFGADASDMTIYLRPVTAPTLSPGFNIDPDWAVAGIRAFVYSADNVTATAYMEIVDTADTVLASGDAEDLANLFDLAEQSRLDVGYDEAAANTQYRFRLRIDVSKTAGTVAELYTLLAEPILAFSTDGSVPAYTPAVGAWWPGAPGRQLVLRTYAEANVAAGATTTMSVTATGFAARIPELWGGSIVGVAYRWVNAITGGTHSIVVQKNGANVWTAFSGASAQGDAVSQEPWADTFVSGDLLTVGITTTAGFLPAGTNDLVVDLYLLLDYDGD